MKAFIKTIGILTSGGDAPGLNAAIRAICISAKEKYGAKVLGFKNGYRGLIENNFVKMSDFDMEVPFHNYIKFDVGDKVVFHDENINKYLKDPKWYEKDEVWATICVVLLCVICYFLICLGIEYCKL